MRRLTVFLPLLLGVLPALAAPPVVTVPETVAGEVGAFVPVRAAVTGAKVVKFVPLDGGLNLFPADLLADKTATVVTSAKPGRYRVLCYSGNGDGPSEPVTTTVVIGGAKPDDVKPQPITADRVFWVVTVEESADRTADAAKVLADLAFWREVGKVHQWRHYDDDSEQGKGYAQKAREKNVTLPALLLYAENAKSGDEPVAVVSLPKTTAGVSEVIKANGGKQ